MGLKLGTLGGGLAEFPRRFFPSGVRVVTPFATSTPALLCSNISARNWGSGGNSKGSHKSKKDGTLCRVTCSSGRHARPVTRRKQVAPARATGGMRARRTLPSITLENATSQKRNSEFGRDASRLWGFKLQQLNKVCWGKLGISHDDQHGPGPGAEVDPEFPDPDRRQAGDQSPETAFPTATSREAAHNPH